MSNDITIPLGLSKIEPDRVFFGFTLFATTLSSRVNLINLRGQVVHAWNTRRPVFYGYMLDNGNLLCGVKTDEVTPLPSGLTGSVMELDWDGKVVWEYRETGLHHDFCRSPNGNTMVLGYEPVPDNIASRVKGGAPGTELHGRMWSDYIREVTPKGETVWEWHASNCLNPDEDETCRLCNRQEWTHANSCKVLPDGNVMTSFRRLDSVAIIDKLSGRFHWRWGKGKIGHHAHQAKQHLGHRVRVGRY